MKTCNRVPKPSKSSFNLANEITDGFFGVNTDSSDSEMHLDDYNFSHGNGREKRKEIRRRNVKIGIAAVLLSVASVVGVKTINEASKPAKIEPAACTFTIENTVWNAAEEISNEGPGFVVGQIMNTAGNEDVDLGAVREGDKVNLPMELCDEALANGARTGKLNNQ